jgi:hypothetical protein
LGCARVVNTTARLGSAWHGRTVRDCCTAADILAHPREDHEVAQMDVGMVAGGLARWERE